MKNFSLSLLSLFLILNMTLPTLAQDKKVVVDQVVAVVGNSAILRSDLHNQRRQLESQGIKFGPDALCDILDDMLYQKLLYNQAVLDSVEISAGQVEQVLERRLRFFIQQIGSREQLEAYYGKSIEALKDEFRPLIREQELSSMMEGIITKDVKVSPSEVRNFFRSLPQDSIPMVESEIEMSQIVKIPAVDPVEVADTKRRLNDFRDRILRGESFNTLAILYSEDPGSARRGGELGFHQRGDLYTEFEATAFTLRPGEVSDIVETPAGYHIIQLIERRGEQINARHILLKPKVSPLDLMKARTELDSIRAQIQRGAITFEEAALKHSDDPGKINQGRMINPYTNTTRFRTEEIEPNLFFVIDKMELDQVSAPVGMMTDEGQQAFRIVKVTTRTEAHRANMETDYDFIQQLALNKKKMDRVNEWIKVRLARTYVYVHDDFKACKFNVNWTEHMP